MEPFEVQAITAERLFVDKIFAAEVYVRPRRSTLCVETKAQKSNTMAERNISLLLEEL